MTDVKYSNMCQYSSKFYIFISFILIYIITYITTILSNTLYNFYQTIFFDRIISLVKFMYICIVSRYLHKLCLIV